MSLIQDIAEWDGKSAKDITKIYDSNNEEESFSDVIINLINDFDLQIGSTWLLKAYLESGNKIKTNQINTILDNLTNLSHWEAKLHILQSIPFMPIPKSKKGNFEVFLRSVLKDKNKFVRAWAYNGFYELAKKYPKYREETNQLLGIAMTNEAASVKARIRNILKKGF